MNQWYTQDSDSCEQVKQLLHLWHLHAEKNKNTKMWVLLECKKKNYKTLKVKKKHAVYLFCWDAESPSHK